MAQDEKMLVPVEPIDTMIEAAVDAFPRFHPSVFPIIYRAMLSAAPAQPAPVARKVSAFPLEGDPIEQMTGLNIQEANDPIETLRTLRGIARARTLCVWADGTYRVMPTLDVPIARQEEGSIVAVIPMAEVGEVAAPDPVAWWCGKPDGTGFPVRDYPGEWPNMAVLPLYTHPSPTPAADDGRSEPDDPTEEVIQAALEVDFDNEDERGAVINLWHVMKAAAPPAADDALRVAVEALEDAAHEAHGRGYVQGFADAVWDETGDYDEETLTENLDPEKLRDGWYDDARHTYLDAQTKALAALKAGGVK